MTGTSRIFGPLEKDHPMVLARKECAACKRRLDVGAYVKLIPLGPGPDPEAQRCARLNEPYNPVSAIVHCACATGWPGKEN